MIGFGGCCFLDGWIAAFAVVPGGMGVNTPGTGTTVLAVSHAFSMT